MATQPTPYKYYTSGDPGSPYFTGGTFPNLPAGGGFREVSYQQSQDLLKQHLALRKTSGIKQSDYERESEQFQSAFKPQSAYESYQNPFTGETLRNVSQEVVNQIQQQQADLASGKIKQIRPGMFVPTGSPAANLAQQIQAGTAPQQPTGIQQGGQIAPSGTTSPTGTQPTATTGQPGQPSTYTGTSIVDFLKSTGQDSSFANRQKLAQSMGVQNYTGSAEQNTNLLNQLKGQQQTTAGQQQPIIYQVKSGDTLSAIARANGVSVDDISGYRSGDPNLIFPGEQLTIKKPFVAPVINEGGAGVGAGTGATDVRGTTDTKGTTTTTLPEIPLTETEKGYAGYLAEQTFNSLYDKMKIDLGLNDLKTQITAANQALLDVQDKKAAEAADINANPWISENLRIKKLTGLEGKYQQRIANQQDFLEQQQKMYDNGVQQAQWASKLMVDQYNEDREFYYQAKQDAADLALKAGVKDAEAPKTLETTQGIVQWDPKSGQWESTGFAPFTAPKTGTVEVDGMTTQQRAAFNQIVTKYSASPLIAASDRTVVLRKMVEQVNKTPENGSLQLGLVYSYVQALDTYQSAVREGELSLVNSIDSKAGQLSNYIQQVQNGQIVRPDVIKQIAGAAKILADTIGTAAKSKENQFKSQAQVNGVGDQWNQFTGGFTPSYDQPTGEETSAPFQGPVQEGQSVENFRNRFNY